MNRISKLKELLELNNEDSFLQHALALEYIKEGDDISAKILFENILTQDPNYAGSYYHLGKLLERLNEIPAAINWYEKGMTVCKTVNDRHAYSELQAALEEINDQ